MVLHVFHVSTTLFSLSLSLSLSLSRVWSWGWGLHGQLGLKNVDDKSLPTHVTLLDKWQVSFIAAGYGHSAVLSSEVSVTCFIMQCSH